MIYQQSMKGYFINVYKLDNILNDYIYQFPKTIPDFFNRLKYFYIKQPTFYMQQVVFLQYTYESRDFACVKLDLKKGDYGFRKSCFEIS